MRMKSFLSASHAAARLRLRLFVCACAALCAAGPAWAITLGPLVQISGPSPFGPLENCGDFPDYAGVPGTNYPGSEVEPWLAVNPANPDNLVAAWQQDRWSNGGARGTVVGVSFDGGNTWQIVPIPGVSDCSGGAFQRASDPWLSFDPGGVLHHMSLVINLDPPAREPGGYGRNGMVASFSVDGGLRWSEPLVLKVDDRARYLNDKNAITADPLDPGWVYAVWDRVKIPEGAVLNPERVLGQGTKTEFTLARSSDYGQTWQPARKVYGPGGGNETLGHQVVVLPDGVLVDVFNEILGDRNDDGGTKNEFNLALLRSPDKGETWLPHGRPIRSNKLQPVGSSTPDLGLPIRDGSVLFDVAVDPQQPRLYAVWQDARFTGFDQIAFAQSLDGGSSWSQPIRVNRTPETPSNPMRQQALIPSIAVNSDGLLAVTYYDFRNDDDTGELADYWVVTCAVDCDDTGGWSQEVRLTDTSFDYAKAPFAGGHFLGDYAGLATDGADFLAVFGQALVQDQSDLFFRRITPN